MIIREYEQKDMKDMIRIWNEVVDEGIAFPQEDCLDMESGAAFFASQSYTGVAETDEGIVGLYILHPFASMISCRVTCSFRYRAALLSFRRWIAFCGQLCTQA